MPLLNTVPQYILIVKLHRIIDSYPWIVWFRLGSNPAVIKQLCAERRMPLLNTLPLYILIVKLHRIIDSYPWFRTGSNPVVIKRLCVERKTL